MTSSSIFRPCFPLASVFEFSFYTIQTMFTRIILIMISLNLFSGCQTVRRTFRSDLQQHFQNHRSGTDLLQVEDISHLPAPVQRYLHHCGFVGHERITNARVVWADSHIRMKPGGRWMRLRTEQYNSVDSPFRIAYMKARLLGLIPFEGRDLYARGHGHMYGRIGKLIKVFDEKDPAIAQSALVIVLAEALLVPGYALSEYIRWEAVDDTTARATISHEGVEATGTFFFNDLVEMLRFETRERYYMDPEQGNVPRAFVAYVGDYRKQGSLVIPGSLHAVWRLESGDYEYWKGSIEAVQYNISS